MPLIKLLDITTNERLGVWEITEDPEYLNACVADRVTEEIQEDLKPGSRYLEYLASRLLLCQLLDAESIVIGKDDKGKPYLHDDDHHISISHTTGYASALISNRGRVGVDIEKVHPRIRKVKHKFLNDDELKWLTPEHDLVQLALLWSAKESVFKVSEEIDVSFRNQILLDCPNQLDHGQFRAIFQKNGESKEYTIHFERIGDNILTYTVDGII